MYQRPPMTLSYSCVIHSSTTCKVAMPDARQVSWCLPHHLHVRFSGARPHNGHPAGVGLLCSCSSHCSHRAAVLPGLHPHWQVPDGVCLHSQLPEWRKGKPCLYLAFWYRDTHLHFQVRPLMSALQLGIACRLHEQQAAGESVLIVHTPSRTF